MKIITFAKKCPGNLILRLFEFGYELHNGLKIIVNTFDPWPLSMLFFAIFANINDEGFV